MPTYKIYKLDEIDYIFTETDTLATYPLEVFNLLRKKDIILKKILIEIFNGTYLDLQKKENELFVKYKTVGKRKLNKLHYIKGTPAFLKKKRDKNKNSTTYYNKHKKRILETRKKYYNENRCGIKEKKRLYYLKIKDTNYYKKKTKEWHTARVICQKCNKNYARGSLNLHIKRMHGIL